jgi:transcriptional regulator with XRE-family HTH domain
LKKQIPETIDSVSTIGDNIKYLRKKEGLTQQAFAAKFDVTRAVIGSYEEGRALPKLSVLQQISISYDVTLDELVNTRLWQTTAQPAGNLRVLTTAVDFSNKEQIVVVPAEASAGYTAGYADPEFIQDLPSFELPVPELDKDKTYRLFQIKGNSMEPIPSGSYVICEYVIDNTDLREGKPYVIVTRDDGIVFKRLYKTNDHHLMLVSDNPDFETYTIPQTEVLEIWKSLGFISFQLPEKQDISVSQLHHMVINLKEELSRIKGSGKEKQ